MRLSGNFSLDEFLVSQTAERKGGEILQHQMNPPQQVIDNMQYLVDETVQPLRTLLGVPMKISSGYRCEELNTAIGGSNRSQHAHGQAADIILSDRMIYELASERTRRVIENKGREIIRQSWRPGINANFYLFAVTCMYLDDLDVDQVIHEYGTPGEPAWVHVSASRERNRRQILRIDRDGSKELTLEEALALGG